MSAERWPGRIREKEWPVHEPLPEDLRAELDRELDALKAAEGVEGVSSDLLRFSGAMARAQAGARAAIRMEAGAPLGTPASGAPAGGDGSRQGEGAAAGGGEALRFDEIELYPSVLEELLRSLDEAAAEKKDDEALLGALSSAAAGKPDLLMKVARAAMPGGDARDLSEIARELNLPFEAVLLVGRMLAAPFLWEARLRAGPRQELDTRSVEGREGGRCRTCGSPPTLAVLEGEDGARRLFCSLCGDSWVAPRLMCAACGTKEQSKLGTLCLDEADPRWIEVCDACKRYLKTVDERRLPEGFDVVPRAEDARTMHLDMIAEEEGYLRSAF